MLKFACFCLAIVFTTPTWSQVEPAAMGGGFELDDTHMMTPPPVSREVYPVVVGSETRANYFSAALVFTGSYVSNLLFVGTASPVSDEMYYFLPSVTYDRHTARQSANLHYSPGFTVYQHTSQLNGVSQDASTDYRFHLSPYTVIELDDRLMQNNNLYNQSNPFGTSGGVAGSPGSSGEVLIAPFASQLSNSSTVGLSHQYARNAMIGGSGSYSFLHYSDASQSTGLNNGNTTSVMGFYSRRLARSEYVGAAYQFSKFITHPIGTYTVSHTVFGFYTHYFTRSFSVSVLGGPERYSNWSADLAKQTAWTPSAQGSLGWQTLRTTVGASFSRAISGAQGLNGAFRADVVEVNGRVAFARGWSAGANTDYSFLKSLTPALYPGGHTTGVGADLEHRITERMNAVVGYRYIHERYDQIPTANFSPDSNRVYVSIDYGFHRPLGQ